MSHHLIAPSDGVNRLIRCRSDTAGVAQLRRLEKLIDREHPCYRPLEAGHWSVVGPGLTLWVSNNLYVPRGTLGETVFR